LSCKLGDRNTRFFHLIANFRKAKSQIMMINHKGAKLRSLPEIKSATVDYFYNLYKAPIGKKVEMGPVAFDQVSYSRLISKKLLIQFYGITLMGLH